MSDSPGKSQSSAPLAALTNPFGIYVHVPFCVHKCSYCDFYSFTKYSAGDFSPYADKVVADLGRAADLLEERWGDLPPVSTIFFGGGTPSLLDLSAIEKIFGAISSRFAVESTAECTLEANPETVTPELARHWKDRTPINRVSLGAQSFQPRFLDRLERIGGPESIRSAVAALREAGFDNYNLDLICSIPGQTESDFASDIDEVVRLAPTHVSFYTLTLKPEHPLAAQLPKEESAARLYESGIERLAAAGYRQYEISNFSLPGYVCRHNLLYWTGGDFLGVGPSASSRFFHEGSFHHLKQRARFADFLTEPFSLAGMESTSPAQTVLEAAFLELRANEGVELERFRARYGYSLSEAKRYRTFLEKGLLAENAGRVRLTRSGILLADSVTSALVDV